MKTLTSIEISPKQQSSHSGVRVARLAITRCDESGKPQVLLAKNCKKNQWELPGGALEPGECLASGGAREVHEEVNAAVVVTSGFVRYLSYPMVGGHRHGQPYVASVARAEHVGGDIYAKSEVTDTLWVSADAVHRLPDLRRDVLPAMTAVGLL
jgi:8-oxo-dGTP pyrophosphatase MutT (NUDIX family)